VDALRDLGTGTALVTANGGIVHKHSFCVLATEPPRNGFRWESPQAEVDASDAAVPVVLHPSGPASIEAYTVMHDRGNLPERAHAAVRLADGARAWAFSDDADTMDELMAAEGVGRSVSVDDAVLRLTS
jgi:acetyl-CoA C-acetyltransferase